MSLQKMKNGFQTELEAERSSTEDSRQQVERTAQELESERSSAEDRKQQTELEMRQLQLGSAFKVFWFFAFFEPTHPGPQTGAPNRKPGSLDAGRNFTKKYKKPNN